MHFLHLRDKSYFGWNKNAFVPPRLIINCWYIYDHCKYREILFFHCKFLLLWLFLGKSFPQYSLHVGVLYREQGIDLTVESQCLLAYLFNWAILTRFHDCENRYYWKLYLVEFWKSFFTMAYPILAFQHS